MRSGAIFADQLQLPAKIPWTFQSGRSFTTPKTLQGKSLKKTTEAQPIIKTCHKFLAIMTTATVPEASLSTLPKADGSATYSFAGYKVTGSVNGPIEAQRRDEHAYEAHVDVVVRPAAGIGGEALDTKSVMTATAHCSRPI